MKFSNQDFSKVVPSLIAVLRELYILSELENGGRFSVNKHVDAEGRCESTSQTKAFTISLLVPIEFNPVEK